MRGVSKGIAAMLIGLVAGALLGVVAFFTLSQASRLETSAEVFLSDLSSLDMLYNGKNMQDYFGIGKAQVLKDYAESGGPEFCGRTSFGGRLVSIWEAESCKASFDTELEVNETNRIILPIVSQYAVRWGLKASTEDGKFCLGLTDKLPFGKYEARSCFDSGLTQDIGSMITDMFSTYNLGSGVCTCEGPYNICWNDDEAANFTYAVLGC